MPGFRVSEQELFEKNGIFEEVTRDNPQRLHVPSKIFKKDDHRNNFYYLYEEHFLSYNRECTGKLSYKNLMQTIKDILVKVSFLHSLLGTLFLIVLVNFGLDLWL